MVIEQLKQSSQVCTGCSACYSICPVNAISMENDQENFRSPVIQMDKCIRCGLCVKTCPQLNREPIEEKYDLPYCYAAYADDSYRAHSSSGGAFPVMASSFLKSGGYVAGVALESDFSLNHIIIDSLNDLKKLQGSKYFQSDKKDCFSQVKELLLGGRSVLFSGTPCEVFGLQLFLQTKKVPTDKLITIDVVCHGVPSADSVKQHIQSLIDPNELETINFRPKDSGWCCDRFTLVKKNGENITHTNQTDNFLKGFDRCIILRQSCYNCAFAEFPRRGDITLGDCWGINKLHPEYNDGKGTSLIIVNSPKGERLLTAVKDEFKLCEEIPIDFVKKNNRFFSYYRPVPERQRFFDLLKKYPFSKALDYAVNKKFDIAVCCNWSGYNYGAHLTQYSMYSVLTHLGYEVLMVEKPNTPPYPPVSEPKLFIHNPYPSYALSPLYASLSDMRELNSRCNTFLVPSDMLWNDKLFGHSQEFYLLAFVQAAKRKISYATSFGWDYYTGNDDAKNRMKFYLNRFSAVSVRETAGVDICRDWNINATAVLDPVFLCQHSVFQDLINRSTLQLTENYLFAYIFWPDAKKKMALKELSKRLHSKIVCVADALDQNKYQGWDWDIKILKIEDWLTYIKNAPMIVADSFHAVCFSIIFEKQFIFVTDDKRDSRVRSLLHKLNIEERIILLNEKTNIPERVLKLLQNPIDYNVLNVKLKEKIDESMSWLQRSLLLPPKINSEPSETILKDYMEKCAQVGGLNRQLLNKKQENTNTEQKIKELQNQLTAMENSKNWRVGKAMLWLPQIIKRWISRN